MRREANERYGQEYSMDKNKRQWDTPRLQFKGSVGDVLKSGGGKLSITGQDPGEMRCEKPHSSNCQ
jgi:hypothetical protein